MKVRQATHDDLFDVLVLARQFSKEASEMHKWDKDKFEAQLTSAIDSSDHALLVAEENTDEVSGFLLGVVTEVYVNHNRAAVELAWFVSKEYRGGKQALSLMKTFEDWASSVEADYVVMSDLKAVADLAPLYGRKGYEEVESAYAKRIK